MTDRRSLPIAMMLAGLTLSPPTASGAAAVDSASGYQEAGEGPVLEEHVNQADCESGALPLTEIIERGRRLFVARFNTYDGQGRPAATGNGVPTRRVLGADPGFLRTSGPDANSCSGCHNDPRPGGAGGFVANVFVLAQVRDPAIHTVSGDLSDERNTLGMMGSGPIEMLAREMTVDLQAARAAARDAAEKGGVPVIRDLVTKGVNFGRLTAFPDGTFDTRGVKGVNADLIVRPFHQKGVVVSLREFTVTAYNHHHGMQAVERFGKARTGSDDFDDDGVADELTVGDITAATIFQAALGTPGTVIPRDRRKARAGRKGRAAFEAIGCADCHRPTLVLNNPTYSEPSPFNLPGNLQVQEVSRTITFDLTRQGLPPRPERLPDGKVIIRAFTDLKRHDLCDAEIDHYCNEKLLQNGVSTREFITRKLWDVGGTAPYGHRGDLTTITEAILAHGGEGRASRDAFSALPKQERDEIVEFLKSLQILPEGVPSVTMSERVLAGEPGAVSRAAIPARGSLATGD